MRAAGRGCRAGSGRGHRRVAVAQAATEVRAGNGRDARAAGATGVRGAGRDHRRGRSGSGGAGRSRSSGHRSSRSVERPPERGHWRVAGRAAGVGDAAALGQPPEFTLAQAATGFVEEDLEGAPRRIWERGDEEDEGGSASRI